MKINILGLSSPARFKLEELERGLLKHQEIWKKQEVETIIHPSCYVQNHYETLEPKAKCQELTDVAKLDKQIIMSLRGGYSTNFMLKHLDLNELDQYQNTIIGHSDLTILLNQIAFNTNWDVYHGPLFTSLLEDDDYTAQNLVGQIKGEIKQLSSVSKLEVINPQLINGVICGGNLSLIVGAIGTKWELDLEQKIILIEDVNEPDFKIDAMMWQLCNHYDLNKVKGFIIGSFKGCNKEYNEQHRGYEYIIKSYLEKYKKAIILNFSSSHESIMTSLPLNKQLNINEKGVITLM